MIVVKKTNKVCILLCKRKKKTRKKKMLFTARERRLHYNQRMTFKSYNSIDAVIKMHKNENTLDRMLNETRNSLRRMEMNLRTV